MTLGPRHEGPHRPGHAAGDHPPEPRDREARRPLRARAGAHRPELRRRAQGALLRGAGGARPGSRAGHHGRHLRRADRPHARRRATVCCARSARTPCWCWATPTAACARCWPSAWASPCSTWRPATAATTTACPEEVNRRVIDHSSTVLMPYTQRSKENLLREGVPGERIYVTGNPINEVLCHYEARIQASDVLARLDLRRGTSSWPPCTAPRTWTATSACVSSPPRSPW